MKDADYRTSHVGRGWDYEQSFRRDPRQALLWARERQELALVVAGLRPVGTYLDFACGTGRITRYIARLTGALSTGIDISPSMLEVAIAAGGDINYLLGDLTFDDNLLAGQQFDLITAFQFFPNAEPKLRTAAMRRLVEHLAPGGALVVNNHQNSTALRYRLVRLRGHVPARITPAADMTAVFDEAGLRVRQVKWVGVVPQEGAALRPDSMWRAVDAIASRLPRAKAWATDVIYVVTA